jgi:hypothetical protein
MGDRMGKTKMGNGVCARVVHTRKGWIKLVTVWGSFRPYLYTFGTTLFCVLFSILQGKDNHKVFKSRIEK